MIETYLVMYRLVNMIVIMCTLDLSITVTLLRFRLGISPFVFVQDDFPVLVMLNTVFNKG